MRTKTKSPTPATFEPPQTPAEPAAPTPAPPPLDDPLSLDVEGLKYALDRTPPKSGKRVVVSVRLTGGGDPPFLDCANLYAFRTRLALATAIADHFGRKTGQVLGHLALLLDRAERARDFGDRPERVVLTSARREAAEKLLRSRDLLDLAARAMESLGHVGEEHVRRLALLIAISRYLAKPLSALLLGPPGTGKSALLDAVRRLTPAEHVIASSRLRAGSLYYMGVDVLRHRLVVVDEFDGHVEASHAVRVLQSAGHVTLTATVRGRAEGITVHGPVAVMSGSVSTTIDLQNTSRCVELQLDCSPAQTKRVQEAQARVWAGLGPEPVDTEPWQDAQRLLADDLPTQVVIPYATRIAFSAATTTDRRACAKVLGLVAACAVLHARQRDRDAAGTIVASPRDYALVYGLLRPVVEGQLEGLSERATTLYRALASGHVKHVSRREAAALLATSYMSATRALEELLAQELLQETGKDRPRRYRLIDASLLGRGATLTPPEAVGNSS